MRPMNYSKEYVEERIHENAEEAKRVRDYGHSMGWSTIEFASRLGIQSQTLYAQLYVRQRISDATRTAIYRTLGTEVGNSILNTEPTYRLPRKAGTTSGAGYNPLTPEMRAQNKLRRRRVVLQRKITRLEHDIAEARRMLDEIDAVYVAA